MSWQAQNIERVEILGSEIGVTLSKRFGAAHARFNASYAYTQSQDPEGNQLIFIPKNQFRAKVICSIQRWTTQLSFVHQGKIYTDSDNTFYMPWYQTADLRVSYVFSWAKQQFSTYIQSSNPTNTEYQSLPYRPMPGRTFQIGIKWNGQKSS